MTHEELKEKFLKAMGGKPPMAARAAWGEFVRTEATEFRFLYDWIVVPAFYSWIYTSPDVDFGEGSEAVSVWIVRFGFVGHDK